MREERGKNKREERGQRRGRDNLGIRRVDYRRDGGPSCFMYEETLNFWLNGSINGGGM